MTKYLITLIVFLIAAILFLYARSKKQNQIRALKKDPRTGTFTDI
jgi:YbbR domain-containing protein